MPGSHIDEPDLLIIKCLRENARIANAELARRVGLSESQCLRRLNALERMGTIRHYRAVVDLNAVGLPVMAFVELQLECPTRARVTAFERIVDARPEVTECWRTSGDTDYLLKASVPDLPALEQLTTDVLSELEGVTVVRTHLAFRNVKASTANLPLAGSHASVPGIGSTGPAASAPPALETEPTRKAASDRARAAKKAASADPRPTARAARRLDEIDLRILDALSINARIANVDLAERVGLSPAACLRRVQALEAQRVIRYYITLVDYPTFNMFVVFIKLRLDRRTRGWQRRFEHAVQDLPSIVEAYRTNGESDYFLRGVVNGLDGLERLISEPLLIRPGIRAVESAIGLRQCVTVSRLAGVV
jgi:DNA-binding Lrp family transcriptional regulator